MYIYFTMALVTFIIPFCFEISENCMTQIYSFPPEFVTERDCFCFLSGV
jgi:hypothetical protein